MPAQLRPRRAFPYAVINISAGFDQESSIFLKKIQARYTGETGEKRPAEHPDPKRESVHRAGGGE